MTDFLQNQVLPFQLESSLLRGRLARMGAPLDQILTQHNYPVPVAKVLAEAVVVSSALAATLKYDGVFTLQAKSDGAISMLVVDVTNDGGLRAYAQVDQAKLALLKEDASLLGKGYLAFTCTLYNQKDRYQGIVELESGSIAHAVQQYFRQSEQIPTGIICAVAQDDAGRWRGGCLLLQRLAKLGGVSGDTPAPHPSLSDGLVRDDAEDWMRAMTVMSPCTPQELTDGTLPLTDLLYRLFHEEGVRVYAATPLRHQCRCSADRVDGMLRSLPRDEVEKMKIDAKVVVTCEFCNKSYEYNEARLDEIYGLSKKSEPT